MPELRTAAQGLERSSRDNNGAEGSGTVPESLGQCFSHWNGITDLKTLLPESPAVFAPYNAVTESGMLPKGLRHRFKLCNFKEFRVCLTSKSGQ